jgi:hypothetical protein
MTHIARLYFVFTSAIVAAVLGDAIVEAISNSMIVWRGQYTDRSSLDLVPMALLGLLTFAIVIASIVRRDLGVARPSNRMLIISASRLLGLRDVMRLLPATLLLQIATLFAMETVEQIVVYGHPLGGAVWLGGPMIASLLVHGALGIACSLMLAKNLAALARAVGHFVRRIVPLALPRMAAAPVLKPDVPYVAARLLLVTEIGERGPPARMRNVAR